MSWNCRAMFNAFRNTNAKQITFKENLPNLIQIVKTNVTLITI